MSDGTGQLHNATSPRLSSKPPELVANGKSFKVIVLGNQGVGKSKMMQNYLIGRSKQKKKDSHRGQKQDLSKLLEPRSANVVFQMVDH